MRNVLSNLESLGGLNKIAHELREWKKLQDAGLKQEARVLKKRAQGHPSSFIVACCAVKLSRISEKCTGKKDLAWVGNWLRKTEFPSWQIKEDEAGSNGKTVQTLIDRHKKRWAKIKRPPILRYNPSPKHDANSVLSPEEEEKCWFGLFSLMAERGLARPIGFGISQGTDWDWDWDLDAEESAGNSKKSVRNFLPQARKRKRA